MARQGPRPPQAAGPAASTMVAVWARPKLSVQLMLILSPGWCASRIDWICAAEVTVCPPLVPFLYVLTGGDLL